MSFTQPGLRVWDFWLANDQWTTTESKEQHLFYLHAPSDDPDPDGHHQRARIGHATSTDLVDWRTVRRPLTEPPAGSNDDRATWTGCTIRDRTGLWHMFYTGVSSRENGQVQRILSATSHDLLDWTRTDLCLEADAAWYEKWTPELPEEHWRDPWVQWIPDLNRWLMYITARANSGASDGRGVIALASSADLTAWTVHSPITTAGRLRQLEVPQLVELDDGWGLLFCHGPDDHSAARLAESDVEREGGLHLYFSDDPTGPFDPGSDLFFHRGAPSTLYGGRFHQHAGRTWLLGSVAGPDDPYRTFGGVSDPIKVLELGRGLIRLNG